jgi:hypothetical protein
VGFTAAGPLIWGVAGHITSARARVAADLRGRRAPFRRRRCGRAKGRCTGTDIVPRKVAAGHRRSYYHTKHSASIVGDYSQGAASGATRSRY